MKLSYLKYLKCFCNSEQFSVYRFENDSFKQLTTINNEEIIDIGLLLCNSCHRYYPIDDGILNMLPDNLFEKESDNFIKKYNHLLPETCRKIEKIDVKKHVGEGEKDTALHKKNEIKARDKQADIYHTYGYWLYGLNEQKVFRSFLKSSPQDVIIELGCGTGRLTKELINSGFSEYIAIDFSEESIRLLINELNKETKNRILFIKGDVCSLPLKNKIADKALSAQVFEHIPGINEQVRFIKELQRVLNINGVAALTIYNYNILKRYNKIQKKGFHDGGTYYENFTKSEIENLFKPHFMIEKAYCLNSYFPFARRLPVRIQQLAESILSKTALNSVLGDIIFIGLTHYRALNNIPMIKRTASNICKFISRNKVRVLFYHRVNRYGDHFGMDPETFEYQIRYLTKHYNIISMSDYLCLVKESEREKNAVLLTFDDGYKDNYTFAYPILKKYSIPATIFLTTDFIDGKIWLWHDIFRYMVENTPLKKVEVNLKDRNYEWRFENNTERLKVRKNIYDLYKDTPRIERMLRLRDLATLLKVDIPEYPTDSYASLSWDNIKEMSKNNIEFGSHTCTHEILSKIKNEDAHYELLQSRKRIEEELQLEVNAFAYPNGQDGDFTDETKILLKKCNYKIAFTTLNGMNNAATDKFSVKRICAGNELGDRFFSEVSGVNIMKEKIKRLLLK